MPSPKLFCLNSARECLHRARRMRLAGARSEAAAALDNARYFLALAADA